MRLKRMINQKRCGWYFAEWDADSLALCWHGIVVLSATAMTVHFRRCTVNFCLQNFEIELDGTQTVRVLVHDNGGMIGMCALEVNQNYLITSTN